MKRLAVALAVVVMGSPASAAHFAMEDAIWQVKCSYVGSNRADAIAAPGEPGASHRHDYFGTPADAFTTLPDLAASEPACTFGSKASNGPEPDDHAAYWAPALLHRGKPIDMSRAELDAYYWLGENHPPVEPFPYGLKIIAGDSHATSPQPFNVVRMRCVDNRGGQGPSGSQIPDCRKGPYPTVVIVVLFPECWDGIRLDSPDHKSHMAYATNGCPASHPVKVPKLTALFRYLGDWHGGPGSSFSSGGVYSAHADFWNAWTPERQQELVDTCLNALVNCRG